MRLNQLPEVANTANPTGGLDDLLFDRYLVVRSGFLQNRGSEGNGCVRIAGDLSYLHGGNGTRVEFEAWDDDPEVSATWIASRARRTTPPEVAIFAYSWGCGYGFTRLARALERKGIPVRVAVLCDPVYFGLWRWRAMIPRTLFRRIYINIPPNVGEVFWFRQHVDKPCGHDLKAQSPYTRIHAPVILNRPHVEMDNAEEFRNECLHIAQQLSERRGRLCSAYA